jgi:hypothetical protein
MFGIIVVGEDGSGHADHAVQTVAKLAAETRDKVVVFHGVVVHQAKGSPFTTETRDEALQIVMAVPGQAVRWASAMASAVAC